MWELDEFEVEQGNPIYVELLYVEAMIVFIESGIELVESKLQNMEYGDEVLRMIKMDVSYE